MKTPEKHLNEACQHELQQIKVRQVSAASFVSLASSIKDFVESKMENVNIALEYSEKLRSWLREAWNDGMIPNDKYPNLLKRIENENEPHEKEIFVLKRQKNSSLMIWKIKSNQFRKD